jgi:hypothetical protein
MGTLDRIVKSGDRGHLGAALGLREVVERGRLRTWLCALLLLVAAAANGAPDLGHKVLGTLGLDAGTQSATGIYVANQFLLYAADDVFDRHGKRLPLALELDAVSNELGFAATYELPRLATYVNVAFALPLANVTGSSDDVQASLDRFGLADVYVQPLRLGWRLRYLDLQTGYAFYIPTGRFEPGGLGSVSRGSWSHEVSIGGTLYFGRDRSWTLSALGSYEREQRKLGIDITRGGTIQIQGGLGKTFARVVEAGMVANALWQVSDDSGTALPPVLRGARDRAFGLGAELDIAEPEARAHVKLRYAHELASASRPQGQILLLSLEFDLWHVH